MDLRARFLGVRAQTETLCAPLSAEDCGAQSMPDASPTKWHLAHTSWFFETFVLARQASYRPLSAEYGYLYNSYYESLGPRQPRAARGLLTRPSLDEVRSYRALVTDGVAALLASRSGDAELESNVELGVQHEQQHQELILTDIKHLFGSNPLRPAYVERSAQRAAAANHAAARAAAPQGARRLAFRGFDGGLCALGHRGGGFAFDNEQPRHRAFLEAYELADRLVTNAEYLEFVRDHGYERPELWLSDGWRVRCEQDWELPLYWRVERSAHGAAAANHTDGPRDALPELYTLAGRQALGLDEPVCHISYYEADAYARWARARLPSEAEWEHAAAEQPIAGNLLEDGLFHPAPAGASATQTFGDTWEWTQSAYAPYPGFRPPAGALGEYNGKFMCNQLVLRGGSCVTPRTHVRASYRNFFPPDARWQFTGLRLARSA